MRAKTLKSNVSVPYVYVEVRFESFNEADRLFHQPANGSCHYSPQQQPIPSAPLGQFKN